MEFKNRIPFVTCTQDRPGQPEQWLEILFPGRPTMSLDVEGALNSIVIQREPQRNSICAKLFRDCRIRRT